MTGSGGCGCCAMEGTCTWTQAPWLEKEDALSRLVVDPTSSLSAVVTGSYVEGEHQSEAELPAEATTITCASQKSGTYATSHSPQLASGRAGRSAWLRRAALRRVGLSSRATLPRRLVSSFVEHAARVRVEQRGVFDNEAARQRALHDLQRRSGWAHTYTRGGGTAGAPSRVRARLPRPLLRARRGSSKFLGRGTP